MYSSIKVSEKMKEETYPEKSENSNNDHGLQSCTNYSLWYFNDALLSTRGLVQHIPIAIAFSRSESALYEMPMKLLAYLKMGHLLAMLTL
ncbi:unnamed protein product [Chironomus riparius]|uniref:Uncharacterized protein n=1 Tax=Chironomus riparius TaxID=315576 RepID=A0A9N9S437_9DIPT|nr:unnamed protein product [Chironomus riparius]